MQVYVPTGSASLTGSLTSFRALSALKNTTVITRCRSKRSSASKVCILSCALGEDKEYLADTGMRDWCWRSESIKPNSSNFHTISKALSKRALCRLLLRVTFRAQTGPFPRIPRHLIRYDHNCAHFSPMYKHLWFELAHRKDSKHTCHLRKTETKRSTGKFV